MLPFMSDYSKKNQSYKLGGGMRFARIALKEPPRLVYDRYENKKLSIRGLSQPHCKYTFFFLIFRVILIWTA